MKVIEKIKVPILTYHSLDESGSVISIPTNVFRQQMKFLSENGFKVITLKNLIDSLGKNHSDFLHTVVLTFDDGFQNFFTDAFPILDEFGFRATVFLVTDFCGKTNEWEGNPSNFPQSKLLSWKEIKQLNGLGIEFGGHTRTHPDLTKISDSLIYSEIFDSKAKIEDALGNEVETFAYPFGKFNPRIKDTVQKSYKAACSTRLGKVQIGSDYFTLERIDTYYLSNPKTFNLLSTKTIDGYMFFRQIMRNLKSFVKNN